MIPVLLKDLLPNPFLSEYVDKYQIFRFIFSDSGILPAKYYTPHPEHCITFYVKDPQRFSYIDLPTIFTYPRCVIIGMFNIPIMRYGGHDFLAIKVILKPTVLYRLTSIPISELTNTYVDAEAVWGKEVGATCKRLNSTDDLNEMLKIIETFLEYLCTANCKSSHPIDKTSQLMFSQNNPISLDVLANESCLSTRQFIRKFEERIGVGAKMFSRLLRFNRAFRMKNNHPDLDWLSIALACGYCDYQHLAKDFKEFTKLTPPSFFEQELKGPERAFGLHEV